MTDKQILDRLHNINRSHAQKMDLISVIKDIAKENSGGENNNTPIENSIEKNNFTIICSYDDIDNNRISYLTLFNKQFAYNSVKPKIITYEKLKEYFNIEKDYDNTHIVYHLISIILNGRLTYIMYIKDENSKVIVPIVNYTINTNYREDYLKIDYTRPDNQQVHSIKIENNYDNGVEITWT